MKKFFDYLGLLLELEIEEGEVVYTDIRFVPDLNEDDFEKISYEKLLNFRIDLTRFSDFEKNVLKKVREIPSGKAMTYKDVAEAAGYNGASRAVGNVMAKNPFPVLVPCHRVIKSDRSLGDYSRGGKKMKKSLLELEGMDFEGDKLKL
ncbi:MAG: MGMT family protein [Candidatus Hydrothermarchaeales archaeon]